MADYIDRLKDENPEYWESLTQEQRERLRNQARKAADQDIRYRVWFSNVKESQSYVEYEAGKDPDAGSQTGDGGGTTDDGTGGSEGGTDEGPAPIPTPPPATPPPAPDTAPGAEDAIDTDARDMLRQFLEDNQLPSSLLTFITDALAAKKSYAQIITELRQTEEYKAAYPENDVRLANGLSWMPEAAIREYRDEARRLAAEYLDVSDVTQEELTNIIGTGWSLRTFEGKLQRMQEWERWGPTVKAIIEFELGHDIDDERAFAFFDDTPTPELDRAYEKGLLRGQPALLGLGVRPEEEAELLRRYGISPEQAFSGYQNLARELPRAERLGLIEAQIGRGVDHFPTGNDLFNDTPFATLFRAIQLGDPEAIAKLQGQMAREVARFQGSGGVATTAKGSLGLLTEEERGL